MLALIPKPMRNCHRGPRSSSSAPPYVGGISGALAVVRARRRSCPKEGGEALPVPTDAATSFSPSPSLEDDVLHDDDDDFLFTPTKGGAACSLSPPYTPPLHLHPS